MKKGFTMIELIFVIVILGILAAVAIPKLGGVKDDAEATKAMTNVKTLKNEIAKYYAIKSKLPNPTDVTDLKTLTNVPNISWDGNNIAVKVGNEEKCIVIELDNANAKITVTKKASPENVVCKTTHKAFDANGLAGEEKIGGDGIYQ